MCAEVPTLESYCHHYMDLEGENYLVSCIFSKGCSEYACTHYICTIYYVRRNASTPTQIAAFSWGAKPLTLWLTKLLLVLTSVDILG